MPVCCLLALVLALPGPLVYTYYNARFSYRIDCPADLRPQPEPENGDGCRFVSTDGQATLTAYARYNVPDGELPTYWRIAQESWQEKEPLSPSTSARSACCRAS